MKNYDVCKNINDFYFNNYAYTTLIFPDFFPAGTPEAQATRDIEKLIELGNYDQAVSLAEACLQKFGAHTQNAFLTWQIFAYWKQGKLPNSEFIAYFSTLEEIFPQEPYVNFDKAAVLVKEKRFNDAVVELKRALAKEHGHAASIVLLFWIYYLSQDDQWKAFLDPIRANQLLPDIVTNLVLIAEAMREKKPSPFYESAEKGDLHEANRALFEKLPALVVEKEPTQKNILLVAAETNYLREFVVTLLLSLIEMKDRDFGIHVHLFNPMGVDLDMLRQYGEKYPQINLSYSYEKTSLAVNAEGTPYYASMRFSRAYQILQQYPCVEKIATVDADVLVRKNPFTREHVSKYETTITTGSEAAPIWNRFAAGFASFSKTPASLESLAHLVNILLRNFSTRKDFWFIDQVALYDMHTQHSGTRKIYRIPFDDLFGKDMQHTDAAVFWTYTNDNKAKDNPMNRERKRLFDLYGIPQDWNRLARGKYGTVVANKNDEYIGRSLIAHGSWCDHEITILRLLLDFGDTVLEIGSNIGSHTLPLAKHVGNDGKVIAMEPQRILFQTLCANIAVNSLSNVHALNVACGESEGELFVSELDPTATQNFGGYQPKNSAGHLKVDLVTIDSLKLEGCKVIKMDIEGMELEALKGGQKTLRELQPMLFFESHGESVKEIAGFLKEFGYTVYDFGIPNDPMYLAAAEKYVAQTRQFNIKPVAAS